MKYLPRDTPMDATADDCHHDGSAEWGILDNELYTRHKSFPRPRWNKVSRVSYTARRITLIASLIILGSQP